MTCAEVDAEIQSYMTKIGKHFSRKWSWNHHHDNCMSKDCCRAMIVDGHMKGTRLVCDYSEGEIEGEEIGSIQVGCKKTQINGSYYCVDHQFSTISKEQSYLMTHT